MSIIDRLHQATQAGHSLASAIAWIVPGADEAFWKKFLADYNPNAPKKRRRKTRSRPRSRNRRTLRADAILSGAELQKKQRGAAIAEQVSRVNEPESTDLDGVQPDPQGGYVVTINGQEVSWIDDEPTAWEIYHAETESDEPRSIPWNVAGQLAVLLC